MSFSHWSLSAMIAASSYLKWPVSSSSWSVNVVAGHPLEHLRCFGSRWSGWETISFFLLQRWPLNCSQRIQIQAEFNCLFWIAPVALPLSPCQRERRSATEKHVVGRWVPQCQEDGSYYPVQCTTGWDCWCVDEDGKEIRGSRRRGWPDCALTGKWIGFYWELCAFVVCLCVGVYVWVCGGGRGRIKKCA